MSIGDYRTEQLFKVGANRLLEAIQSAAVEVGLTVTSVDPDLNRIALRGLPSTFSWGENLVASIRSLDGGQCLLTIQSSLQFGGNIAGNHRHAIVCERVISATAGMLREGAVPAELKYYKPMSRRNRRRLAVAIILVVFVVPSMAYIISVLLRP